MPNGCPAVKGIFVSHAIGKIIV